MVREEFKAGGIIVAKRSHSILLINRAQSCLCSQSQLSKGQSTETRISPFGTPFSTARMGTVHVITQSVVMGAHYNTVLMGD